MPMHDSKSLNDNVTVRTGNIREVKQKRLLLSNLREAFVHFKEVSPDVVIGFSSFASLRPRQVVLPGDALQKGSSPPPTSELYIFFLQGSGGTHTVCVCQLCHNPTLALGGSGMASDEHFKRIFDADPHRDMTTKVGAPTRFCSTVGALTISAFRDPIPTELKLCRPL